MKPAIKYSVIAELDGKEVYRCDNVSKDALKAVEMEANLILGKEINRQALFLTDELADDFGEVITDEFLNESDRQYDSYEAIRDMENYR